ncbi:MAG: cytochrome c biogenesis protein CcsA [Flavisolibacter sp.]
MNYLGEHLVPGRLGHFFLLLSLVSSLGATLCYFFSVQNNSVLEGMHWKKLARIFFLADVLSVFSCFGIIYYINTNHFFEYTYAYKHSSLSLEPKYLLSGIWEGMEGSFLLWTLWHCVLGVIFILRERQWEPPVMAVISFAQFCLATMLLGISFWGLKLGSNPFLLLRNSGILDNAPVFHDLNGAIRADYLSLLKDGNDLNPLLQNYWMVIHPPVLFMGFASTIIPFAFAIGGLWTKKYALWPKAALPWALFSAGILSLGIMMGAAWAYESLNFGGYWAWDPVENASLVPWLVLVAGIHALLIYVHTGNALRTTHLFLILSFLLILYSTFLTRSGVLQDTSVHAFTDLGMNLQLNLFLFIFLIPALFLFSWRYKKIPFIAKEEETSAREFWMFIGSIILFLSALLIICMTSIPVFNKMAAFFTGRDKLLNPLAIGEDAAYAYNRILVFVAILLGLLSGTGMYLKYRNTSGAFLKRLFLPGIISLILGLVVVIFGNINYLDKGYGYLVAICIAIVAAIFSIITNGFYIKTGLNGKLNRSGGTVAHVGFALMLLGILISSSKKEVLSYNTSGISVFIGNDPKNKPGENLTLVKGLRTDMGQYWVTYDKDSAHPIKALWFYHLKFEGKDGKDSFSLLPNAFVNYKGNTGLMANPDAKHFLTHDIFTYITSLPDPDKTKDTSRFVDKPLTVGDTLFYAKGLAVLEKLESVKHIPNIDFSLSDSATVATIKVFAQSNSFYTLKPILISKGGVLFSHPDTLVAEGLVLQLQKVDGKTAVLGVKDSESLLPYVTLKAYKFPFIILLWFGTIVMVLGFIMSMIRRFQTGQKSKAIKKLHPIKDAV